MKISIIIPVYNEVDEVGACISSLSGQTLEHELIIVDDGSTDGTIEKVEQIVSGTKRMHLLTQSHRGPGAARNLGATRASGEIFVFIDADMTFAPDFIQTLVEPIVRKLTKGTFTKAEYVSNWENVWARCWNYNQGLGSSRRIPENYPETAPVFRAILAKEFKRVGGFSEGIGWTDDWSLSRKLGYQATATEAICYHTNPKTLAEVFTQGKWVGKNEFLSGTLSRRLLNSIRHALPVSIVSGMVIALKYRCARFMLFKLIYDFAISLALWQSLIQADRNK